MSKLIFTDDPSGEWTRAVQRGAARRVARGTYTEDLATPLVDLVRARTWELVAHFFPGAVITDRTRRDLVLPRPPQHAYVFVAREGRRRRVELPGLTVTARPGVAAQAGDTPFNNGLVLASEARALLENARVSRPRGTAPASTLSREELQDWIGELAGQRTTSGLRAIREQARELAAPLGLAKEFKRVDRLIDIALGLSTEIAIAPALRAVQTGRPYDHRRIAMFDALAARLRDRAPRVIGAHPDDRERHTVLPFFEAYFSNFIEGTEFTVEAAERIVFEREIPADRPADAHDVLGTYAITSDPDEMRRRPDSADDFVGLLRARHQRVMDGRPDKHPSDWKHEDNRVGAYPFVDRDLVEGTLVRSFNNYSSLDFAFDRALYLMFVVTEVHPFDDGNGRIARVMMNVELVGASQTRIVIPTVFRYEYLAALRLLSTADEPDALSSVLSFAQRWTARVDWSSVETAMQALSRSNALLDPREAEERGLKLTLP